MGKHSQYGIILDAGSSGTRLYIYKWKHPIAARKHADPEELQRLPKLKLKKSKKIHPGIASFAQDVSSVGRYYLQSLVDVALHEVPADKIAETPIYLMATAGVRFLPEAQQTSLLQSVCDYLKSAANFDLPDCNERVKVITGETEGLYGWIATNYLLDGFDRSEQNFHGKGHHTYGFLDMGGASAQIAFAPNATESERHADDLQLIRLRRLDGSMSEYKIFTATWLGFGANKARSRYVQSLLDSYDNSVKEIPDPCMPKGLRNPSTGQVEGGPTREQTIVGTGAFLECLKKTYPLLEKDAPCKDQPCLLNGQHVPGIDFEVNHFVGVSEYWHTTHGVFGQEKKAYDLATYQHKVTEFCSQDWATIEKNLTKRKKSHAQKVQDAQDACFKASWLINILYEGIGIPRLGVDSTLSAGLNSTLDSSEESRAFLESFQPIDTVNGVEVSWTLGKMLLYAAGQITPDSSSSLPVGFGSNEASKAPSDFEYAGSSPLGPLPESDRDDLDPDDSTSLPGYFPWNIAGLLVVVLLVAYLFRKSDRRHRLWSGIPCPRRRPGRRPRPTLGLGLVSKVFGRRSPDYERVLEGGEATDFELETASDDLSWSDSSEGSRGSRQPGPGTPKVNSERFDDVHPSFVMDRTGLVLRTESRERLNTTLHMLKAGRKAEQAAPRG